MSLTQPAGKQRKGSRRSKGRKSASLSSLENKLDRLFSMFIRRRDANDEGMGYCVTCGRWAKLQCGHFVKRQHRATRWDERNAAGQCAMPCNHGLGGAQDEFAHHILTKYGQDTLDELMRLKHTTRKFSRDELLELIKRYS